MVADVSCIICGTVLGWKYVDAKEVGQKYKIGKYILEMKRVVVMVSWEEVEGGSGVGDEGETRELEGDSNAVVFDSDDEEECEEIFEGTWDAEIVAKRRGRRVMKKKVSMV